MKIPTNPYHPATISLIILEEIILSKSNQKRIENLLFILYNIKFSQFIS